MNAGLGDSAQVRFAQVVTPHLDDAYSLARWLSGDPSDAQDIVQEACLRALQGLAKATIDHPRAWLMAIVRNTAFTWLAKHRSSKVVIASDDEVAALSDASEAFDPTPSAEEDLIAAADRKAVNDAIMMLPQAFREAIVMREINGMSYREICAATGAPMGTVMSRLARARALLANSLGRSQ
jgi:RNA polymerase sigma-70 factor (ECF subfamily)